VNILVLTPQALHPLHDGLNLRVHHLYRELAKSHNVWILCLVADSTISPSGSGPSGLAGIRHVRIAGQPGKAFRHGRDFSREAAQAIAAFLEEVSVDVIVAESIYMLPYARALLPKPLLLDLVDAMSLLLWRSFRAEPNWAERARYLRAWHFWRNYERQHLPDFPHIAVTSEQDAHVVRRRAPQANVQVIPNGVDTDLFSPMPVRANGPEVVFTGVMGYRPNELAAIHFYKRVFPLVRARIPNVRLTLAGKGPTPRLHEVVSRDPAVAVTGFLEDIRPCIARASAYVAPMVSGAGIKNKILEAWAMERPVVGTPLAWGGLEGLPGQTHFVAESPRLFADCVVRLLENRELRQAMGRRARDLVLERYQWSAQSSRLAAALKAIPRS